MELTNTLEQNGPQLARLSDSPMPQSLEQANQTGSTLEQLQAQIINAEGQPDNLGANQQLLGSLIQSFQELIGVLEGLVGKMMKPGNSPEVPQPSATSAAQAPAHNCQASEANPAETTPATAPSAQTPAESQVQVPEYGVPDKTIDIEKYMSTTFGDSEEVSESRSFLGVVGWGFNVMDQANPSAGLHEFFNEAKSEILNQQAESGNIDYEAVGKQILQMAVEKGLITKHQADHTYGNAHAVASELTGDKGAIEDKSVSREAAISGISSKLNFFIQNATENEFRDIDQ